MINPIKRVKRFLYGSEEGLGDTPGSAVWVKILCWVPVFCAIWSVIMLTGTGLWYGGKYLWRIMGH